MKLTPVTARQETPPRYVRRMVSMEKKRGFRYPYLMRTGRTYLANLMRWAGNRTNASGTA